MSQNVTIPEADAVGDSGILKCVKYNLVSKINKYRVLSCLCLDNSQCKTSPDRNLL